MVILKIIKWTNDMKDLLKNDDGYFPIWKRMKIYFINICVCRIIVKSYGDQSSNSLWIFFLPIFTEKTFLLVARLLQLLQGNALTWVWYASSHSEAIFLCQQLQYQLVRGKFVWRVIHFRFYEVWNIILSSYYKRLFSLSIKTLCNLLITIQCSNSACTLC